MDELKIGDIVKYTKEYLKMFKPKDIDKEFVVIRISNDLVLIKDAKEKSFFTKKLINTYWIYKKCDKCDDTRNYKQLLRENIKRTGQWNATIRDMILIMSDEEAERMYYSMYVKD